MITLQDTITYVTSQADEQALEHVIDAVKQRRKALRSVRAAAVGVGAQVRIGEISPKYLIGMTGDVVDIVGNRATVRLNEESTLLLRLKGTRRFYVPDDQLCYDLDGIPLSCCFTDEVNGSEGQGR